jgi:hypothetical protein
MRISGGIFYQLTFENDIEPDDFMTTLSSKIAAHPEKDAPTRAGKFTKLTVFASRHNRVLEPDNKVQPIIKYLFLVEGSVAKLPWLAALLGEFGQVAFPLSESDWTLVE